MGGSGKGFIGWGLGLGQGLHQGGSEEEGFRDLLGGSAEEGFIREGLGKKALLGGVWVWDKGFIGEYLRKRASGTCWEGLGKRLHQGRGYNWVEVLVWRGWEGGLAQSAST